MKPVICIAGPTASGKSAYALRVAKAVGGEIINADALQVYADLRILSARPTPEEMEGIPHHLFGHVAGETRYSTGKWLRDVEPQILDCLGRDVVPVLVGGTGLYFRALLQGLADIPPVPQDVFDDTQALYDTQGITSIRALAERLDPIAAANVVGDDPQRLMRIICVARATGTPLSVWQADTHPVIPSCFTRFCVLTPPRENLYARINARYDEMLREGGLVEAEAVLAKGYDDSLPVMKAIGLRQLYLYFSGLQSLTDAIEDAKRESRRFAKRQLTWFRNQPPKGQPLLDQAAQDAFLADIKGLSF